MATADKYKPMKSRVVKSKMPVEIIRCVGNDGKYVLVKKYEGDWRDLRDGRRRKHNRVPLFTFEYEPCKLDMPAKFKLSHHGNLSGFEANKDYTVQMIKYCIEKQNTNEYELRNLVTTYLKSKRREMDKDKFREVCDIFDKADKMLSRADRRKNSNINEANVSYRFLVKSYSRIVNMCEVKKKVVEDTSFPYIHRRGYGFNDDIIQLMEKLVFMIQNGAIYNEDYNTMTVRVYNYPAMNRNLDLPVYEVDTNIFKNYINQFYRGVFI